MNKSYRNIWNETAQAWVAAPETATGHGPGAVRDAVAGMARSAAAKVLLGTASGLLATSAFAVECGGTPGSTVTASGGAACVVTGNNGTDYNYTRITVSGAGTQATFVSPDELTPANFTASATVPNSGVVTVGTGAQAVFTGDLGITAVGGVNARGIYNVGTSSVVVDGNLQIAHGAGGSNGAGLETGDIFVRGTTTISTSGAGSATGARLWGKSHFVGDASFTQTGTPGSGINNAALYISSSVANTHAFDGKLTVRNQGHSAPAIYQANGTVVVGGALDVGSTGNGSPAVQVLAGSFTAQAAATLDTKGSGSHGIQVTGASASAALVTAGIKTAGGGAHGLFASNGGKITATGAVVVTTQAVNAHGMLVTGAGAKVNYVDGTFNSGGHGVYALNGGTITSTGNTVINVGAEFGAMAEGAGASLSLNNVTVAHTTPAFSSNGVAAYAGGVVNVTGATDITSGTDAYISSVYARGDNSVVRLGSSTSIQHQGNSLGGAGLATQYGAGTITAAGPVTITTQGAPGIYADPTGTITLQDINVAVGSNGNPSPHGVFANGAGANISYTKGTLNTTGTGLLAEGGGVISASGDTTIVATGAAADGIRVGANSRITAAGAMNIAATGAGTGVCSSGVAVCLVGDNATVTAGHVASASRIQSATTTVRMEAGANMVATLDNASLTTTGASSDLLSVSGATGSSALNLRNSTATASAGGLLLNVASGSTFAFDNDNTVLTGDIKASADSTVNMALHNGSRLTGKIDPVNLNIDATSRWDMTGDSLLANLGNAGTINVLPGAGGVAGTYKTLTATNYVGNGGRINLNTYLGDDSSPSDKLVVDGGSATGSTRLGITNAGGSGALTTGNGILVVDAQNGATTATGAFALAGAVSAGAYDYSLVRRANQNWYLSSELITVPPVDPGTPLNPDTPGVTPPATPPAAMPNYRQETSLYAAVPSLAILHSAATMDSFHERVGAAGPAAGAGDQPSRLWLRVLGNTGERKGDALGVYGRTGPAFDHKSYALQLGGDLYRGANANGSQTAAGVYLATGQTTGDVTHFNGAAAGGVKLDVSSLGMYWTLLGPAGGYVDFVAQGNHYGVTATSTRMPTLKTSGSGYDVSVEGGLPFQLSGPWSVEPQLQLRLLSADIGHGHDIAGRVHYGDAESLVGRAGVKLAYKGSRLTAWTRLDLLNEFKGRSRTQVASLWGTNGVDFNSSVHGAAVALTAGVDAKLTDRVSLYGSASYRRALGDNRGHAWGAQAGVKVAW